MVDMASITTPWPEDMMKQYQWLDEYLQGLSGTEKEFQSSWEAYKYLIRGKMYAYIGIDDRNGRPIITLKLDPDFSAEFRKQYTDIVEGYYMNKLHWSTVYLDGEVPRETILNIAAASYAVLLSTLSKKAQREIKDTQS